MSSTTLLHYFDQPSDSDVSISESYFDEESKVEDLTPEVLDLFIAEILFENQILSYANIVNHVLENVSTVFRREDTLLNIVSPVTVVGDIHGQLPDLLRVLQMGGLVIDVETKGFSMPEEGKFLFMGDYVDRGYFSVEVVLLLFGLKLKYPDRVFMLRGNHEVRDINMMYGFASHITKVFANFEMWEIFNQVFDLIPISAVVDGKAFCVHGGISPKLETLAEIAEVDRFIHGMHPGIMDMLWSDPNDYIDTFQLSPRGAGYIWGEDATNNFLERNDLEMIIRAHELQMGGYSFQHSDKVLTVFSASNYCYRLGNDAAILKIEDGTYKLSTFSPL